MNAVAPSKLQRLNSVCPIFVAWAQQELRHQAAQVDRDQLARARHVGAGSGFLGNKDFGPLIRFLRGDVEPEYRADPDPEVGPLVHGGRVRDGIHAMHARKLITDQQWHAVCAFRDNLDIAAGARPEAFERLAGIRTPLRGSRWPEDAQIDALRQLRGAWARIPRSLQPLTVWTVIGGGTLDDFARVAGVRRAIVSGMWAYTIVVIDEIYGV